MRGQGQTLLAWMESARDGLLRGVCGASLAIGIALLASACDQTLPTTQGDAPETINSKLVVVEKAPETSAPSAPAPSPGPGEVAREPELVKIDIKILGQYLSPEQATTIDLNRGAAFSFSVVGQFLSNASNKESATAMTAVTLTDKVDFASANSNMNCIRGSMIQCTAMALGHYELRISLGNKVFLLNGDVKDPGITSISITPAFNTIKLDDEVKLDVIAFYGNSKQEYVTSLASLNLVNAASEVLTLTGSGATGYTIKAIGAGEETIEVKYLDYRAEWTIKVEGDSLTAIHVDTPNPSPTVGKQFSLTVWGEYTDSIRRNISDRVRWTIADASLASTVASPGSLFNALQAGSTNFKASFAGIEGQLDVALTSGLNITSISVVPSNALVAMAAPFQFTARGKDGNTFVDVSSQVQWTVQDPSVLKISSAGVATPIKLGSTTVSARYKNLPVITVLAQVIEPQPVSIKIVPDVADPADLPAEGEAFNLSCGSALHNFKALATLTDGSEIDLTASADVSWASSDASFIALATAGSAAPGRFESLKEGTVAITATYVNPVTSATLDASLNLVVQQGPQTGLEVKADKDTKAVGYSFIFSAESVHTCNRKVPLAAQTLDWQVTPALSDPNLFQFDVAQPGQARTSGDNATFVDVQIRVSQTLPDGASMSTTKTVRVLPKQLASLALSGPSANYSAATYLFDQGVAANLEVTGVYSNGMTGTYADLLAEGYTFTWTSDLPAALTVDTTTLAVQLGALGESKVKLAYVPGGGAPAITSNIINTRTVRPCAAPGKREGDLYYCFFVGNAGDSCATTCANNSLAYDSVATLALGSNGDSDGERCRKAAVAHFGQAGVVVFPSFLAITTAAPGQALGCYLNASSRLFRIVNIPTNDTASEAGMRRLCGCM